MRSRLVMPIGLLTLASVAVAQDIEDAGGSYFDDFPVVLSASRLAQPVDQAAAAVTVIDREMIRASGVREVVDLFRLVPGFVVGQYKSHQPTIGFFGLTDPLYHQLQVLIDGVSIYSSAWGGAEWSELPIDLEDIERVEIVRGPNAAAFGANSFLGVVNIITRDPALEHGRMFIARLGENQVRDELYRFANNDDDLRYRVTAGQKADSGLDSYPDSRRTNFFNLRAHWRPNLHDEVRVQTAYSGGAQEDGKYGDDTNGARTAHFDSGSVQLRWTRVYDPDRELWLQFSHSQRTFRDVFPYTLNLSGVGLGLWDYPIDYGYDRRRTDLELQQTTRFDEALRMVWGAQARSDGVRSIPYFSSDQWQSSSLYRIFANAEWHPAERWTLNGGAMVERNSISGSSASPSLSISRELAANQSVRVRFASARRTPTIYEDRANWAYWLPDGLRNNLLSLGAPWSTLADLPLARSSIGNSDLKDERVHSREFSYLALMPNSHLNAELHWFEHRISDLIRQYKVPAETILGELGKQEAQEAWTIGNLSNARVVGLSTAVHWRPYAGTLLYVAASRSRIHASGADAERIEASGPHSTLSILGSQSFPAGYALSCGYYLVGEMHSLSEGDSLPRTERVDLRLARSMIIGPSRVETALVIQRATGGEPVFGLSDIDKRTAWLSVRVEY